MIRISSQKGKYCKFRTRLQQLGATYKFWTCSKPCHGPWISPMQSRDARSDTMEAQRHVVTQCTTNHTWNVSVSGPALREEVMAQVAEIFDSGFHVVLLVNKVKNNINRMNILSLPMIRPKGLYSWLRDIIGAAVVWTNLPEHHLRTHIAYRIMSTVSPERYNWLARMHHQNRRIVTIKHRQFGSLDLLAPTSQKPYDSPHNGR